LLSPNTLNETARQSKTHAGRTKPKRDGSAIFRG